MHAHTHEHTHTKDTKDTVQHDVTLNYTKQLTISAKADITKPRVCNDLYLAIQELQYHAPTQLTY